ncbi:MAG: DUF502 domain-containing protein [Gemmatimonadota bacterium]|nr:MAG: DUF502 domain-containing protein [Gemmatimonadota bacterium]
MKADKSTWSLIRRYLLTGIVVIAPVGVTAYVLWWIFARLDRILGRVFQVIGLRIPGLGLMVLIALVIAVGWAAQQAIGRELITLGKAWLKRFPLTRTIYGAASQIVEQMVGEDRKFFKSCVLVEYPRPGCWAIGFLTSEAAREINETTQEDSLAVFIPTTPNPTSGYLVFLPRHQVVPLKMTVEEGFKLVVSAGAVTPELLGVTGEERVEAGRR